MLRVRRLGALAACVAVAVILSADGAAAPRQPVPLGGVPLGTTGLRLLVANMQPFVFDVDSGRTTVLRGLPRSSRGSLYVVDLGGAGAIAVGCGSPNNCFYGVTANTDRVTPWGTGRNIYRGTSPRSVWITSSLGPSRCALRETSLDGQTIRSARPFPCGAVTDPSGLLGLVVHRTKLIDPVTTHTRRTTRYGVVAVAAKHLVLAGPGHRFTLLDVASGARKLFAWPSILSGSDGAVVDPSGRFVALGFAVPAWQGGGRQAMDVWILNTVTGTLTQLPGMPAFVSLKRTSMNWTLDSRLVLLAENNGRAIVAVWRPGQQRLAASMVPLRKRDGDSDSFAILSPTS
jgi:hypothetical protein